MHHLHHLDEVQLVSSSVVAELRHFSRLEMGEKPELGYQAWPFDERRWQLPELELFEC